MLEVLSAERLRELLADWQPLRALNLEGGDYRGVDLSNARLEEVDARGAQFTGAILTQSHWKDCRLDGANFSDSTADSSHMNGCSLQRIVHECALEQGQLGAMLRRGSGSVGRAATGFYALGVPRTAYQTGSRPVEQIPMEPVRSDGP